MQTRLAVVTAKMYYNHNIMAEISEPSAKIRQKRETHAKILASCARVLRRSGIKAASVATVMEGAGLTVGGFYAHFKSKEAMVAETFRWALQEQGRISSGLLPPGLTGDRKLRAFLASYLSVQHRDRDLQGEGCALAALSAEMGKASKNLRKVFHS